MEVELKSIEMKREERERGGEVEVQNRGKTFKGVEQTS